MSHILIEHIEIEHSERKGLQSHWLEERPSYPVPWHHLEYRLVTQGRGYIDEKPIIESE